MRQINNFLSEIKEYYYITKDGQVISSARRNKKILKPSKKKNGYLQVSLVKNDGSIKYISIHRLVALAFLPKNNNGALQVNHIDGDKENNSFSNLEWVTSKENISHAWNNNISKPRTGEKSNLSSISEYKAKMIVEMLETCEYTDKEIGLILKVDPKTIVSRIRRKETWKHLTKDLGEIGLSQKRK